MISFSFFELTLLILSALLIGSVLFHFFIGEKRTSSEKEMLAEEELIDAAAKKRLQSYEETDLFLPPSSSQHTLDQLAKRMDRLEQEWTSRTESSSYSKNNASALSDEPAYSDESTPENSDSEEEAFFQAKEELELALYRAKKQWKQIQESNYSDSPSYIQQQINAFGTKIEQFNQGLLSNHYSTQQMTEHKKEIENEVEVLLASTAIEETKTQ